MQAEPVSDTADARFHRRSAVQHAAVSIEQTLELGLSRAQIRRRLSTGAFVLLRPGVLAPAGAPPTWDQAVMAATLAAGSGAVASHETAAALWGLTPRPKTSIEVSDARARQHRLPGIRAHRFVVLDPDRARLGRIPLTSTARTIVDLSGRLTAERLGAFVDDAIRRRMVTLEALAACAARLAPAPGRRLSVVRQVLSERGSEFDPGESVFESRVLRAIAAAGLPSPAIQHRVTINGRRYRVDLAYPDQGLAIELDGYAVHGTRSAFDADRARGNDLVMAGLTLLRFTTAMTDDQIVRSIRRAIERAA